MTLHEDCVQRVRKKVGGFDARLAELGPDVVVAPLLAELADFYEVSIDDLLEGFALRDNPDAVYDRHAQPRLSTGELDTSVLGPECDTELDRHGWRDRVGAVEAYATPYDPRLPLVRSRIALRADGIAWVSYFRPQNFQVAPFERLRLIHQQSEQWVLEFDDWRRRRIADRETGGEWLGFLDALRELSGLAGLEWKDPTQGRRDLAYDSVIYNVAGWSTEERAALEPVPPRGVDPPRLGRVRPARPERLREAGRPHHRRPVGLLGDRPSTAVQSGRAVTVSVSVPERMMAPARTSVNSPWRTDSSPPTKTWWMPSASP